MTQSRIDDQKQNIKHDRYYDLGHEYFNENKWREARIHFNNTLALTPNNIDVLYMRGRTELYLNQSGKAEDDFKKIILLQPANQHAHFLLGLGLLQLNDYEAALAAINECLRMKPDDPSACIYQGWSLINLKMYDQAKLSFQKAIKISPTFHAFYHYARALYSIHAQGQENLYEEAITNFDKCLAKNPTYFYAYFRKAQILLELKQKEEAELLFRACAKVAPNRFISWYLYALGLFLLEKYHQSLHVCEKSLNLCKDFPAAIILKKETEAKIKSLNDHTKEKYIMLNRIEQISSQNLNNKVAELEKKLTEVISDLKRYEELVAAQQINIKDLHSENIKLHIELIQIKTQLTKQKMLDEILLDETVKGNLDGINGAISLGANITVKNEDGYTTLHLAVFNQQKQAAELLLSKEKGKILFLIPDLSKGLTPMQYIAQDNKKLDMLPWLFEQGKKITEFYNDPNEFDKVYKVATNEAKDILADLKLLDSAKTGNKQGIIDALEKGADINFIGPDGPALHIAMYCKRNKIIKFLIDEGADPTIIYWNETPLKMAIDLKNQELISLLATPFLIFSAAHGDIEGMKNSLNLGANLIGKDKYGQTALHKAVIKNSKECIKYLLQMHVERGHDIQIPDNKEITPHKLAKELNNTLTTKKGKVVDTAYYLSNQQGKEYMKHKLNNINASISNSRFGFVNTISGNSVSTYSPPTENEIKQNRPKH